MLFTTRNTLLCTLIFGLGACERGAPTAAPPDANTPAPPPEFLIVPASLGTPLPGLSGAQRRQFDIGRVVFQTEFTPETGLGPLFNATSCASCHEQPVVGGGGSNDGEGGEDIEIHATTFQYGTAQCDDLAAVGGPVIQKQLTPAFSEYMHLTSEPIPATATDSGHRTTPDLFGFGLLDAVPEAEILALADPLDRNGDGISGRPNRTADGRLGRFGRKAQVATLREFNTDAFVMEMGVTNPGNQTEQTIGGEPLPPGIDPLPEPEIGAVQLAAADAFVRFLAPPPRGPLSFAAARGALLFRSVGCASCHVPALVTGANPNPALRFRVVRAFTDLLLHDMGPDLADICLGQALPSEFRTEPLMGLRFASTFLHDGRAATIRQAIELHGGEALGARNRFLQLTELEKYALVKFLKTL
ncbi:MAG TPA: di-heme oxidoredictase family protein [Gemmatimonadales bacterium]